MAVTKPTKIPLFCKEIGDDGEGTKESPISGQKNATDPSNIGYDDSEGFTLHQEVPRQVLNWFMGLTGKWISWIDEALSSLDSDGVKNKSSVDGTTVTNALNSILTAIVAIRPTYTVYPAKIVFTYSAGSNEEVDLAVRRTEYANKVEIEIVGFGSSSIPSSPTSASIYPKTDVEGLFKGIPHDARATQGLVTTVIQSGLVGGKLRLLRIDGVVPDLLDIDDQILSFPKTT